MSSLSEYVSGSGLGWISGGSGGFLISAALEGSTLMFGEGMLDISFGIPGKAGRLVLVDNFSGSSSDDSSDLSASIAGLLMTGTSKQSEIWTWFCLDRTEGIQYLPRTVLVQGESFCMGTSHVHCKSDSSVVAHTVLI